MAESGYGDGNDEFSNSGWHFQEQYCDMFVLVGRQPNGDGFLVRSV